VCTDIIHFHNRSLFYYPGDYSAFVRHRNDHLTKLSTMQAALDSKRDHIKQSIDRMKQAARKNGHPEQNMGLIASRHKKLERMGFEKTADGKKFNAQRHSRRAGSANDNQGGWVDGHMTAASQAEAAERDFKFIFPEPDMSKLGLDGSMVKLKNVSFRYPSSSSSSSDDADSPMLFSNVNLDIVAGMKIGVVGLNGAGKSTLLSILASNLQPAGGEVFRSNYLTVSYFTQHHADSLDLALTPLQHIRQQFPTLRESEARAVLGRFGLGGAVALRPIGTLSGGQRSRVVFATITKHAPQLLILDEPSNHADARTIKALIEAIQSFKGAVILVSHDQAVLSEACNSLWIVEKNVVSKSKGAAAAAGQDGAPAPPPARSRIRKFPGGFEAYRQQVINSVA